VHRKEQQKGGGNTLKEKRIITRGWSDISSESFSHSSSFEGAICWHLFYRVSQVSFISLLVKQDGQLLLLVLVVVVLVTATRVNRPFPFTFG